LEKDKGE